MAEIKRQLFVQLALMGQSLASPQRIELLDYLAQAERAVDELAQLTGLSVANTSRHLQQLKQAGLVNVRKEGKSRLYTLASDEVVRLMQQLRHTAQLHLAEVNRLQGQLHPSTPMLLRTQSNAAHTAEEASEPEISREALASLLSDAPSGELSDASPAVLVLDVRPAKEFAQGHIKGAKNILPESLDQVPSLFLSPPSSSNALNSLRSLPKDQVIVAYCRGPYCVYAYELVTQLRKQGLNARRLVDGFPEWKAAGLAIDQAW